MATRDMSFSNSDDVINSSDVMNISKVLFLWHW